MAPKSAGDQLCQLLAASVLLDDAALSLLANSANEGKHVDFVAHLESLLPSSASHSNFDDLLRDFIDFCARSAIYSNSAISKAIERRKAERNHLRQVRRNIIKSLRLNATLTQSECIRQHWQYYYEKSLQPDSRIPRHPLPREDPAKINRVVAEDENVIFYDAKTGDVVLMVVRNFCADADILQWVDEVIQSMVPLKKDIWKEDPGEMVQIGYTAGARSQPSFDWARNLKSKKHSPEFICSLDYKCSSVFALFWNMLLGCLPDQIIDDLTNYLDATGICRMDASGSRTSSHGEYTVKKGDDAVVFRDVELAPPTGVFAVNYARHGPDHDCTAYANFCAARAMHYEHMPHNYAISWTTNRRGTSSAGSNFYLAKYGIKVVAAANTMVAWRSRDIHGMNLQDRSPYDDEPGFLQASMSFVTSSRIKTIWERYAAEVISVQEAEALLAGDAEGDIQYDSD
ncbi:hypothetical protein B0H21DRAFT_865180 [Amylocystis lapponica]|nr:hypothetical protein B0H21DRAFT_865180 [Amylocystis lapponica]